MKREGEREAYIVGHAQRPMLGQVSCHLDPQSRICFDHLQCDVLSCFNRLNQIKRRQEEVMEEIAGEERLKRGGSG